MDRKSLWLILIFLVVSACAPSRSGNPADRFAGTWSGTMGFTDDANRKEDIVVTIPSACATGSACGDLNNKTVNCRWEMILALRIQFSRLRPSARQAKNVSDGSQARSPPVFEIDVERALFDLKGK